MASTEQLVQQPSHMFASNGAALQCGLNAMPHKDEEQGRRGQLLHTLHCLLQEAKDTRGRAVSVWPRHYTPYLSAWSPHTQPSLRPLPWLTFMSLRCRYSSMMALDFFSSSSSESTDFGGLTGGRVASRFTERAKNRSKTLQFLSSQ